MVPFTCFSAGFGSGKTLIAGFKALLLSALHKRCPGIVCEPTYRMLEDIMIPSFRDEILGPLGLEPYCKWSAKEMRYRMPWGNDILFRSTERPSRLRGYTIAWFLVDEASLVLKFDEVWGSLTSRLRHPLVKRTVTGDPLFFGGVLGTPEGDYDEIYDLFFRPPEDPAKYDYWKKNFHVITATSMDNPGLPKAFIENLNANVIPELRAAHIGGQYVNLGRGKVYWHSEETNIRKTAYDPHIPLRLSFDFNLDPMVAIVWQRAGRDQNGKFMRVIDEIGIKNSNTREVCEVFAERFRGHMHKIIVNGDATGGRSTAEFSDYETIVEHLRGKFVGGVEIAVYDANPPHKRRVHSVNKKLTSGEIEIDPKCRRLIRDLRYQRWDPKNGKSKDKNQRMDGETLGHASDCLDYAVDYYWPYRLPAAPQRGIQARTSALHNWDTR